MALRNLPLLLFCLLAPALPAESAVLRLATTTSVDNSGLLAYLLPSFEEVSGYRVDVIAVGSGKAMRLGEAGDVDLLITHDPATEEAFVAAGYGEARVPLMINEFVIIGPRDDPAAVTASTSGADLMARLHGSGVRFISRGDDSGTHRRELALWATANLQPEAPWYLESGQSMAAVLRMSHELDAYTLSDRGTWLAYRAQLPTLTELWSSPEALANPYSVLPLSRDRHPDLNHAAAEDFVRWLHTSAAIALIAGFKVDGEPLFRPLIAPPAPESPDD